MKTLGKKISELRKLHELTQEGLAAKLNVTSQAVSKWENDLSIPDLPILIEISDLFHVSLDELLKQKENMNSPVIVEEKFRKPVEQMMLKILVNSVDGDKVKVNLPMALVKAGVMMGMSMPEVGGTDVLKTIDLDALIALVDQGLVGKLVEVDSADGDHIEIFVE
ncbi:MAG: helix-turn-helix transcriptional regulator [Erysipelotrichaceae bacterium]|nr:helix-turn-helix transcriptional regulator [Erysipelotrichaceae bacterium]MBQ4344082.1 helix-turn-helix transcriptional regulator [Erysipelotrichaceae bacterium]